MSDNNHTIIGSFRNKEGRLFTIRIGICPICQKSYTYSMRPSKSKKFCSQACCGISRRGINNHKYKGGFTIKAGYRVICVDGIRKYEHRHVMEQHLGRPLLSTEVVHHKDHNRANNDISNLELLSSHSEHRKLHSTRYAGEFEKQCSFCNEIKLRTEFFKQKQRRDGDDSHRAECKSCYYIKYR